MTRAIDVRLYDTTIGVWQDSANDPTFRAEIYIGLVRLMRRRGWTVGPDPRIAKHYPSLDKDHRLATRGAMRAEIEVAGRQVTVQFWAETWPIDNPNGRRYDFNKRQRLDYLDRVRVDLETQKIIAWLRRRATVTISRGDIAAGTGPGQVTAEAFIAHRYAGCWHTDKALGRPVCRYDYNGKSGDGGVVEHGATVWFPDRKGRICRGTAFYNINNMWWVATGQYRLENKGSHDILTRCPSDLRIKRNARARRGRLEGELARAIRACDFQRAERLKRILFGDSTPYGIWSRKESAYYRPNCSGYTIDALSAGRYTRDEAEAEVRRCPDILSLVMPDGRHVEAAALEQRVAA
tara:strand:+ start:22718 stop:23767 length:1050 start_codon:yes stop_codon:yes gene_type:complete